MNEIIKQYNVNYSIFLILTYWVTESKAIDIKPIKTLIFTVFTWNFKAIPQEK